MVKSSDNWDDVGSDLVAEEVLLGGLHHASALPAQLRHHRLDLCGTHSRAIVRGAQALQRNVHCAEGSCSANACNGTSAGPLYGSHYLLDSITATS